MKYILISIFLSIYAFAYDVTVSILPQKYFVEQIAKDKVNVNVMVKPGFSPATYSPKTSQMRKLSKSKIYFSIDVPFENAWLEKFKYSNKNMIIVDTANNINKIEMTKHEHHDEHEENETHHEEKDHDKHKHHEEHGENEIHHVEKDHDEHKHHEEHGENETHHVKKDHDEHNHDGLDPHIWLDPSLVKIQAKTILEALINIDKKNKDFYTSNYKNFIKEINTLDTKIKNILKNNKDSAFMVFHPSWNYFAKAYDLEQIAVEKEGKNPKIKEIIELVKEAKEHNIKIVFVSPQFSQNSAKKIASSINGKVVNIDPLALDWKNNLIKVANSIKNSNK